MPTIPISNGAHDSDPKRSFVQITPKIFFSKLEGRSIYNLNIDFGNTHVEDVDGICIII